MRTRRTPDAAWSEAAARRLAQLTADLGGTGTPVPQHTPVGPTAASSQRAGQSRMPAESGGRPLTDPVEPNGVPPPGHEWWADHTRVAVPVRQAPAPTAAAPRPAANKKPEPVAWPRPGRHASRRRRTTRWRLPELGAAHVAVVAVLVAVGLAVTTWSVLRDQPEPVAPVPVAGASPLVDGLATDPVSPEASGAASGAGGEVTIDVTGKVRRPGIVVLDAGARVVDALEAAGGARARVDLSSLNLARVLVDGEQIVVGRPAAAVPVAPPGSAAVPGAPTQLVNLNLATAIELEALPEVGPVTAAAIVAWRDENGGFTSVDELLEVSGIGELTLESIAPFVTV